MPGCFGVRRLRLAARPITFSRLTSLPELVPLTPLATFALASLLMQPPRPFTRILSAATSGFSEPAEMVLRDRASLSGAWSTLANGVAGNPPPNVNFARTMLVLLALGPRGTGGHSIHVDSVQASGNDLVVHYTVTSPGRDCVSVQMLTSPVAVISIERNSGDVHFKRRSMVGTC